MVICIAARCCRDRFYIATVTRYRLGNGRSTQGVAT
jgi:hypothetical protein